MKTSVLIIAHNEESYISQCIESVLDQTQKPDEVVIVVHNSTDGTGEIARKYPIKAITFNGPVGIIEARLEGLKHVTGERILCIDGDSYASKNWVEIMTKTLEGNALVGSFIKYKGNMFARISNTFNKYLCSSKGNRATMWIWGASFAFWKKDIQLVEKVWKDSVGLSRQANLSRNPEDYWLALFMGRHGNLEVTNKTHVIAYVKENSFISGLRRHFEDVGNGARARNLLRSLPVDAS